MTKTQLQNLKHQLNAIKDYNYYGKLVPIDGVGENGNDTIWEKSWDFNRVSRIDRLKTPQEYNHYAYHSSITPFLILLDTLRYEYEITSEFGIISMHIPDIQVYITIENDDINNQDEIEIEYNGHQKYDIKTIYEFLYDDLTNDIIIKHLSII